MTVEVAVDGLTKRFGQVLAVDHLSFVVRPGRVTGFLGPNGAGKTTTLGMAVGLVAADAGTVTLGGRAYRELAEPSRLVGAAIGTGGFHPGRSGRDHLLIVARQAGLDPDSVSTWLERVGLVEAADRRVGGYSAGMRQRLALATALLGDPQVLLLDEPANGLDPEGIAWLRELLRWLADAGRTVLMSSHQLAEVAQTADDVVIIDHGRLVVEQPLPDLLAGSSPKVRVRTPLPEKLSATLAARGLSAEPLGPEELLVDVPDPAAVGAAAAAAGIELHLLVQEQPDLEDVFLSLVAGEATDSRGDRP